MEAQRCLRTTLEWDWNGDFRFSPGYHFNDDRYDKIKKHTSSLFVDFFMLTFFKDIWENMLIWKELKRKWVFLVKNNGAHLRRMDSHTTTSTPLRGKCCRSFFVKAKSSFSLDNENANVFLICLTRDNNSVLPVRWG